jgi:hypothetical protein
MTTETIVVLVGAGVALLAILMLRLGKRLAIGLLILGGLAAVVAVALALLAQASANRETAIAAQKAAEAAQIAAAGQSMTSAATGLTLFLVALLVVLALGFGGACAAWRWWQKRQKQEQYADMLRQAQLYALMAGGRMPALRMPSIPQWPTYTAPGASGPVIVVGQQPPAYSPYPYTYPPSAIGQAEYDPYAGLLPPPDDDGWEVLD